MKKFYVLLTYIANYSKLMEIEARDATAAHKACTDWFGPEFHAKSTVYIFTEPPVVTYMKGEKIFYGAGQ